MRSQPKVVTPAQRQRQLLFIVFLVFIAFMVFRSCAHSENRFEKDARAVTLAIQKNDAASIGKLFNADARERMNNRQRFGKASDDLNALGKINSVHETTAKDAADRTHTMLIAGEKANVTETYHYDLDGKIDRFKYDPVVPNAK